MQNLNHLLDDTIRIKLVEKLQSITPSINKAIFWYEELKLNYLDISESDRFEGIELAPFKFEVPVQEKDEFAQWVLENYLELSNNPDKKRRFFDLETEIETFEKLFKEEKNQKAFIGKYLKEIDQSFENILLQTSGISSRQFLMLSPQNGKYFASYQAYQNYIKWEEGPEYKDLPSSVVYILAAKNGLEVAKFRNYIASRLEQGKKVKQKELTIPQQLLILDYLGIINKLDGLDKTVKSEFLSQLIGKSEQNTREKLTDFSKMKESKVSSEKQKINKDLLVIKDWFKVLGLKKELRLVDGDLEKLDL